ncbi:MAG: PEP/pyruvate-binding domain-containing protein [Patescibacteria group bacterium]
MQFILPFSKISKKDVGLAGGKGASLGEMSQAGIPVPPGFVVLATAFDRFLHETGLEVDIEAQLKKVNYKDVNSVDKYSAVIRDLIHRAKMPRDLQSEIMNAYANLVSGQRQIVNNKAVTSHKLSAISQLPFYVAVRSSATAEDSTQASWAGELETYLNTTEKDLLRYVKDCWSSLFTPRAIFYRREKKMHKAKVSVAVVVQAMVQSEISGVAFTVHPVTKDRNQMIIEAGYGLGEAIVSGQITPDSYIIDKKNLSLLDINVAEQTRQLIGLVKGGNKWQAVAKKDGAKQKLTGQQIIELAKICVNIEQHYKFPCDIEWAYYKGKFYITQSRPITTL